MCQLTEEGMPSVLFRQSTDRISSPLEHSEAISKISICCIVFKVPLLIWGEIWRRLVSTRDDCFELGLKRAYLRGQPGAHNEGTG